MSNDQFVHQRHKPTSEGGARELILACPPLRSNINVARIVRAATCSGVQRMIVSGNPKIDPKVARDGLEHIEIENRRSLLPVLKQFRADGVPFRNVACCCWATNDWGLAKNYWLWSTTW
jgi:hypothetical protein